MTEPQLQSAPLGGGVSDIEAVAQSLASLARQFASETERRRQLAAPLVEALRDSGLLRAGAPLEVGALELAPGVALRCAEEIARGDASAGWCVSIAITSSLLAAYLPAESRDELFGVEQAVASGVWAPRGTARPVDGGVVVSGRWAFCSGISHADLLFAGCMIDDGGESASERVLPSVVALRKEDLQVLDNWHTLGLRGTGSADAVADEVFVPAARVLAVRWSSARPSAVSLPDLRVLRAVGRRAPVGKRAGGDRRSRRAGAKQSRVGAEPHARQTHVHTIRGRDRRGVATRRPRLLLRGHRRGLGGRANGRAGLRRAAQRPPPRRHARRARRPRSSGRCTTSRAGPRSTTTRRCSSDFATRTRPPRTSRSTKRHANSRARSFSGSPSTRPHCEPTDRSRPAVLVRPARRRSARHRPRGPLCRADHTVDRRDGHLRRRCTRDGGRPSRAGSTTEDRPDGNRRQKPGLDRARRFFGGRAHRQPRRRRARRPAR